MVHQCANPTCGKPLHFLREGKIFVFDLPDATVTPGQGPGGREARRLQHFWLCGSCSQTMLMVQNEGAQIQVKLMLGKVGSGKALRS
jgi:hypothetical protein